MQRECVLMTCQHQAVLKYYHTQVLVLCSSINFPHWCMASAESVRADQLHVQQHDGPSHRDNVVVHDVRNDLIWCPR